MVGVIDGLTTDQQLELIYIGYFGRSADAAGLAFWDAQNAQAEASGQSAADALSNIANSFAPQPETIALYPFLGADPSHIDLTDPAVQAALGGLIDGIYGNLFGRAADAGGKAYWTDQMTSGAVGIGSAVLAIANGALGADAIDVRNKIVVALDFTDRVTAVEPSTSPSALVAAAHAVLTGVDGLASHDESVIAGMNATTLFIETPTQLNTLQIADAAPSEAELASINQTVHPYILQFTGGGATVDASAIPATTYFDALGTGYVDITNLSDTQHVAAFSGGSHLAGQFTISSAPGNTILNLDLAFVSVYLGGRELNGVIPYDGIGLSGLTQINITSNGPGLNVIAGIFDANLGAGVDDEHVTITGSADLVLGAPPPDTVFPAFNVATGLTYPAFPGVTAGGIVIDASRFLGSLSYTSSGKGDTITGGFGNDSFASAANDKITPGSGTDTIFLLQGKYTSPTAADITTIAGFNGASDMIVIVARTELASATTYFDLTSADLSKSANAAAAAQAAFVLNASHGTTEKAGDVVAFSFGGDTYDAFSVDGNFGANGYVAPGTGMPNEMLVKLTGGAIAQAAHDFAFTSFTGVV